ncbi:hypothetical protein FEM48_Zijuj11G0136800 [Ziziphus jujuba var. spinosa]|uniref:DUF4220 domain-containing protein n=1 Tax=Ziziphus jujuba var. spinosa TaxID=714518 RepID=A0A978UJ94_ZIZJJ|nr:uncharacterized protein LOC107431333 [Ziziphus jujuba var. spinosa]KAH7514875.1 hypothetical protein FEM48_Zijuj11G0136800 [Ziziphus jujuba var. spinosa]
MELTIAKKVEKLWDKWDIPACVLLSLLMQVFLVIFASLRKRSRNPFLVILIWSAYLIANWIAAVTIGLITKVQAQNGRHGNYQDLYAFWASFLLLHLGGPDTITSFALEDNELWLRHLFGLILQVNGAAYCSFLALPYNNLWLPTILVFVVGSVKYAERTMSLYLASMNHFGATVGEPNAEDEGTKFDFNSESNTSNHMKLLMVSYSLLKSFKGIVGGFVLSSKAAESSRKLFLQINKPNVCFKLIEYELSLMYEVLHTKVTVVRSRIGFMFRLSSFFLIIGAFLLFCFVVVKDNNKDHEFSGFELSLTYALLIGAIGLDTISGIKLLFSDWIIVSNNGLIKRWRKYIPEFVLKRSRWCGSVSQYNIIDYCLDERLIWKCKFPDCFRVMIDGVKFMLFPSSSSVDDMEQLKCFIFEELTNKPRNDWGLDEIMSSDSDEINFAQMVLQSHLTTEICYHHQTVTELMSYTNERRRERRMSKLISDYIFYLLIMKPEMMGSSVRGANWKKVFQDTFAEAKSQLMQHKIYDHVEACNHFMKYAEVKDKSTSRRGDGMNASSKSLLPDACKDALRRTNWGELRQYWLCLLLLGAIKCRPMLHAQQPSRGGELLTFTLFLIQHLGLLPGDKS